MIAPADFLTYLNMVLVTALAIGGFFALRHGYSKTAGEIQERVISALKAQNELLETRIKDFEQEIGHLKHILETIKFALERRGLKMEIGAEVITLIDEQGAQKQTSTVRIVPHGETDLKGACKYRHRSAWEADRIGR